jgi:hypothetical protein
MRFAEGQYREMASPLSRWGWRGSKPRLTPTSQLLPWAGAASRRFVANMGAARPSLPAGFKSVPALQAALQQVKFKFRRQNPPLHRWETVYRRLAERLATADTPDGALRSIVDAWFYTLEEDVIASGNVDPGDANGLVAATDALVEQRLSTISRTAPAFSAVLRAYRRALLADEAALAEGLIAWLGGQPNVAATVKRAAGVKGISIHSGPCTFWLDY